MIGAFFLFLTQAITVGGFDKVPPVAIARGGADLRSIVAKAAVSCGVSETWEYDAVLWAHSNDMTAKRRACLARASRSSTERSQADRPRGSID